MKPDDAVINLGVSMIIDLDDKKGLETLKACLARSGASPTQFARMMGVHRSTLSLWIAGKRPVPAIAIRAAYLCTMLSGVPVRMANPSQFWYGEN